MANIDIHSGGLRPLDGAILAENKVAGDDIDHDAPALTMNTDGTVEPTADGSAKCLGLYVGNERKEVDAVEGDHVAVVIFGRVAGFEGLTPGTLLFLSSDAGKLADSGTVAVAYAETDEIAVVMPAITNVASS